MMRGFIKRLRDDGFKNRFIGKEGIELVHLIELKEKVNELFADPCRFCNY